MTDHVQEADKRCQIEVEIKDTGFTKLVIVATTEEKALDLFKKVREELKK